MKKVVIGAGYGDEGKGLMVDYFVEQIINQTGEKPLVVRFNGGPQAAHTVQRDGIRHVFGSFGSGSLLGAPTFFDKETLISPTLINHEAKVLGNNPMLYIHPEAKIITPYDVLWNHYKAAANGDNSSCGVGIFATICRDKVIPIRVGESFFEKEADVREYYIKLLEAETLDNSFIDRFLNILNNPKSELWEEFTTDCELCDVEITEFPEEYEHVVFEGAQGLLLDEKYGEMPFCTPSNTGVQNVKQYLDDDTDVVYVSRCYSTRHGDGPLEGECDPKDLGFRVGDITNVTNDFQGKMRYAPLNLNKILNTIIKDSNDLYCPRLAITCLDQVRDIKVLGHDDYTQQEFVEAYIPDYISEGPTAKTVSHLFRG